MPKILRDFAAFIFALIEILLIFRFVLKLLGASVGSSFVSWIYVTSQPLLQPFLFAFPTPKISDGFVLEFTTLFAIFAYAFCGYIAQELLRIISKKSKN